MTDINLTERAVRELDDPGFTDRYVTLTTNGVHEDSVFLMIHGNAIKPGEEPCYTLSRSELYIAARDLLGLVDPLDALL